MIKANYKKYILNFKNPSGTSRGVLRTKETWFIILDKKGKKGIGETGLFRGLSIDDFSNYEEKLSWACQNINLGLDFFTKRTMGVSINSIWIRTSFFIPEV